MGKTCSDKIIIPDTFSLLCAHHSCMHYSDDDHDDGDEDEPYGLEVEVTDHTPSCGI